MMQAQRTWHGCLFITLFIASPLLAQTNVTAVQSRVFEIEYEVNEDAMPLHSVVLWYTLDKGKTWHQYGPDEDRHSPITFNTPAEGLYGFVLVVTNAAGSSGPAPRYPTQPHQWAFVDYTPPIVQVHPPRYVVEFGQKVLQIRWTTIDANLTSRPIEIAFQRPTSEDWYPITADPLGNTGRYDWGLPAKLTGIIKIRITATDRGGHRVHGESAMVDITRVVQPSAEEMLEQRGRLPSSIIGESVADLATVADRIRAERLYREALGFAGRGESSLGIARLRDAVALNPQMTEAFVEMATLLYKLGDLDGARRGYSIAVSQEPNQRAALQGLAKVDLTNNLYDAAGEKLRTILRYNPRDAEIWMNLGDLAIYEGDDLRALEYYGLASTIDPQKTGIVDQALKRIALMEKAIQEEGKNRQ